MRVTFDGSVLSTDSFAADETWATSFHISGQQVNQISRPVRAEYVSLYARGGRAHSIEIIFRPPPAVSYDAAAESLSLYFAGLPQQGDLVLTNGSLARTFPAACLEAFTPPPRTGISLEFPLKFVAGAVTYQTLSPLALMDSRYVANLAVITGLTGGTAADLDALVTADVAVGFVAFVTPTIAGIAQPKHFRLITDPDPGVTVTNTDPTAGALIVRPLDYDEDENAKIWSEQ